MASGSSKPRLLDLFCGAGGAAMGYHRAGFGEIVGVDIKPQPRYPFEFVQADALEYVLEYGHEFDAIHASPPCQFATMATRQWRADGREYPDLLEQTRRGLEAIGRPFVIENVPGAPLINPTILNGGMFRLKVRRTRLFETSFDMPLVLRPPEARAKFKMGRPVVEGDTITPVGHFSNVSYAQQEMDIDWMGQADLAQAIPPAYTEYIGHALIQNLGH
jgi:DNA (cytosine-5)-methyltransferase 1